jgi:hypothetical protein
MPDDWSHEETDDPGFADRRNFYKVEKWSRDGQRIEELLFAGNSLAKAQRNLRAAYPEAAKVPVDDQAADEGVAGVASGMRSTPSLRGHPQPQDQISSRGGIETAGHGYDHRLQHRWSFVFNACVEISCTCTHCSCSWLFKQHFFAWLFQMLSERGFLHDPQVVSRHRR